MHNADYGSHTGPGELLFPIYHFLQAWLKMDHDTAISVDHMTAFEWRICVQLDWNVNMTTMHDSLNVHMQRLWTKYDLDATENSPTKKTLRLLKH